MLECKANTTPNLCGCWITSPRLIVRCDPDVLHSIPPLNLWTLMCITRSMKGRSGKAAHPDCLFNFGIPQHSLRICFPSKTQKLRQLFRHLIQHLKAISRRKACFYLCLANRLVYGNRNSFAQTQFRFIDLEWLGNVCYSPKRETVHPLCSLLLQKRAAVDLVLGFCDLGAVMLTLNRAWTMAALGFQFLHVVLVCWATADRIAEGARISAISQRQRGSVSTGWWESHSAALLRKIHTHREDASSMCAFASVLRHLTRLLPTSGICHVYQQEWLPDSLMGLITTVICFNAYCLKPS